MSTATCAASEAWNRCQASEPEAKTTHAIESAQLINPEEENVDGVSSSWCCAARIVNAQMIHQETLLVERKAENQICHPSFAKESSLK